MVSLRELKKALNQKVKAAMPEVNIVAEEIKEGFAKPAVFTEALLINSSEPHINYGKRLITLIINYYPVKASGIEKMRFYDLMDQTFRTVFLVNGVHLSILNKTTYDMDSAYQFTFDIRSMVANDYRETETEEVMKEIEMRDR